MTDENGTKSRVLKVLEEHPGKPLEIGYIARKAGIQWLQAAWILADLLLTELDTSYPKVLKTLAIVPERTVEDSWLFRPQLKKVEEVA